MARSHKYDACCSSSWNDSDSPCGLGDDLVIIGIFLYHTLSQSSSYLRDGDILESFLLGCCYSPKNLTHPAAANILVMIVIVRVICWWKMGGSSEMRSFVTLVFSVLNITGIRRSWISPIIVGSWWAFSRCVFFWATLDLSSSHSNLSCF